jgi:hypothetical protein
MNLLLVGWPRSLREALLELLRIRATRTALIAKLEFVETDMRELRRLLALDRYERYAHTKQRRASVKLADISAAE